MDPTQKAQELLPVVEELAASLVAEVWEHLPGYEPTRMDREDLAAVVEPNLRSLLTAFVENRQPSGEELRSAHELGERRAIQGVPIEGMLGSWRAAERALLVRLLVGWESVTPLELVATCRRLAVVVDTLAEASTAAYRRTRAELSSHIAHVETDLVSRLAAGEPLEPSEVESRAQLIGVDIQRPHRALAFALDGRDDQVVLGRAHRLLLDHLRPQLRGRALAGSHQGTLLALLPDSPDVMPRLERALHRAEMPTDLVLGLGEPRPRLGESAASCREAQAALDVGLRLHAHRTVVAYRAVMPEVLMAANQETARAIVQSTLGPVLAQETLLLTLRTYLDTALSSRRTAELLHIHENTVSYRLRRITELLGVDAPHRIVRLDILMALRALQLMPAASNAPDAEVGDHDKLPGDGHEAAR